MSNPWDETKDGEFSAKDRQKLRYLMQLNLDREPMMRRIVQVYRSWWMVAVGVVAAFSGIVGGVVDFIAKSAGVGQ